MEFKVMARKTNGIAIRIMQTDGFKNVYGLKGGFID
jgi:predicted sulfurtransferase